MRHDYRSFVSSLMLSFSIRFVLTFLLTSAITSSLRAEDHRALPVDPDPPVTAPAFFDVVTFQVHDEGENHQMVVTSGPKQVRVDETGDGYSIIYNAPTDHYTGLEHRNYTYWEFSWSEVKAAVATTKRYETHLRDLGSEGVSGYDQPTAATTNTDGAPATAASIGSDNSGYVWKTTPDKKKIGGIDCIRWIGETVSGESVEAWCFNGPLPKVQAAMDQLRRINEPIALVPVRTLVPPLVFPLYDALVKGGSTPLLITWGDARDKSHFSFVSAKTRDPKPELFAIPKLYVKTTLITMDGITNPVSETAGPEQKKRAGGGNGF